MVLSKAHEPSRIYHGQEVGMGGQVDGLSALLLRRIQLRAFIIEDATIFKQWWLCLELPTGLILTLREGSLDDEGKWKMEAENALHSIDLHLEGRPKEDVSRETITPWLAWYGIWLHGINTEYMGEDEKLQLLAHGYKPIRGVAQSG